jgi:N-methylhydantoinase B/oxoprolinase/acetone carboxylase alpha subunit
MTNSLNTPCEALEIDFPIEIQNYSLRENSGGCGKFNGGCGLIRSYKFLKDTHVSILSERRHNQPYGLQGGEPGQTGENLLIKKQKQDNRDNHFIEMETITLGSKVNIEIDSGDVLVIKTPGGGGYGKKE